LFETLRLLKNNNITPRKYGTTHPPTIHTVSLASWWRLKAFIFRKSRKELGRATEMMVPAEFSGCPPLTAPENKLNEPAPAPA
jgi:hypothetical protein